MRYAGGNDNSIFQRDIGVGNLFEYIGGVPIYCEQLLVQYAATTVCLASSDYGARRCLHLRHLANGQRCTPILQRIQVTNDLAAN